MKQKIIKCNNIKEDRGILSNQIKTKRKKRIKMALVEEKVKEEDRELFNSFVPNRKAYDCTKWIVDREKNIYFFRVGGEAREHIDVYFMSWNNIKIYIYTESRIIVGGRVYIWIDSILIYKKLDSKSEIVKEIIDTIKAALQIRYDNSIKFQEIANPTFEEEKKQMNTIEDIIEWIKDYDNPNDNIEKFTAELIQMISDMDYTASNGGAAVGYAGLIGYSKDVKSAIFLTVENLTGNSNGNENKF